MTLGRLFLSASVKRVNYCSVQLQTYFKISVRQYTKELRCWEASRNVLKRYCDPMCMLQVLRRQESRPSCHLSLSPICRLIPPKGVLTHVELHSPLRDFWVWASRTCSVFITNFRLGLSEVYFPSRLPSKRVTGLLREDTFWDVKSWLSTQLEHTICEH